MPHLDERPSALSPGSAAAGPSFNDTTVFDADGGYSVYVRFRLKRREDERRDPKDPVNALLNAGHTMRSALALAFSERLEEALPRDLREAYVVFHNASAADDPALAFGVEHGKAAKPWPLTEYMKAARNLCDRMRTALSALGLPVDPELRASIDRVHETRLDDLVGVGAEEIRDNYDKLSETHDALVEKVRAAHSTAQSLVGEIEDALPSWAKDRHR